MLRQERFAASSIPRVNVCEFSQKTSWNSKIPVMTTFLDIFETLKTCDSVSIILLGMILVETSQVLTGLVASQAGC